MAPIKQFSVVLDSGKTIYHPGDDVKGRVFVHLNEVASIRSVILSFNGEANVWYSDKTDFRYQLTQPYFSFESYLVGAADQRGKSVKFSPGQYSFPFSFTLPLVSLPSSYQDKTAFVQYLLEAVLKKPTMKAKVAIIVKEPVRVHTPYLQIGQTKQDIQDISCCGDRSGGKVNVSGKINRSGFYPGEVIQTKFYVENQSIRHVTSTQMKLIQKVIKTYSQDGHAHIKSKVLSITESNGVPARTEADNEGLNLTVPDPVLPSTDSEDSIVRVCYTVRLTAHVKGRCNNACRVEFPITIGYMPDGGFDWSRIEPAHFPSTGKMWGSVPMQMY